MVYNGNENYIFISYAHADAERVLPIVEALDNAGFRVWYDSGIEAGTEWPEYIEERLANAHVVLAFMTPSAVESRNCRNEINFALELKKEMLVVYLEETTLLKGMRLQLNSTQSMFRKHHKSDESFLQELLRAKILRDCNTATVPQVEPVPAPTAVKQTVAPAKPSKKPLFIALGVLLTALIVVLAVMAFGGKDGESKDAGGSKPDQETTQPATEPAPTIVEMSDNLMDFTLEIEGKVYQLPCKYQDLADAGWTISYSEVDDTTKVAGQSEVSFSMVYNGRTISVSVFNSSGDSKRIKDCYVGGFLWALGDGPSTKLAKGITAASTVDEIVAAYGAPTSRRDETDYTILAYGDNPNCVKFFLYHEEKMQKYNEITVENVVVAEEDKTETNTNRPDYLDEYRAPTQLGTEYNSGVMKLQGMLYQLPAPVSTFTANGWKIVQQPGYVMSGNTEIIRVEQNGQRLDLYVQNFSDYQTTPENCAVYGLDVYAEDGIEVELPGGITFQSTKADVERIFTGDKVDYYQGSSHSWSYFDDDAGLTVSVRADLETGKVTKIGVIHKVWDYK